MNERQIQELKEGLTKIVKRLNREFSYLGKFRLRRKDNDFYIRYREKFLSQELDDTVIEVLPDRIGYQGSNMRYKEIVDEFLQQFSIKYRIRIGTLGGL